MFPSFPTWEALFPASNLFLFAKFASFTRQKHSVFPRGIEPWQIEKTFMETCFQHVSGNMFLVSRLYTCNETNTITKCKGTGNTFFVTDVCYTRQGSVLMHCSVSNFGRAEEYRVFVIKRFVRGSFVRSFEAPLYNHPRNPRKKTTTRNLKKYYQA